MLRYSPGTPVLLVIFLCQIVNPTETILSIHRAVNTKISSSLQDHQDSDGHYENDLSSDELFIKNSAHANLDYSDVSKTCDGNDDYCRKLNKIQELSTNNSTESYTRTIAAAYSLFCATLVGLSGVFPLMVLPNIEAGGNMFEDGDNAKKLNRLLSFAVGGLLGDVFLHLLPESWNHLQHVDEHGKHSHFVAMTNGIWVLIGLISFCFLEKLFPDDVLNDEVSQTDVSKNLNITANGYNSNHSNNKAQNGNCVHSIHKKYVQEQNGESEKVTEMNNNVTSKQRKVKISGYLNLFANCIDNFTHGLALAGSFLVSRRVGILTTIAILLHEIPHEVGDFAILLRAGFDRWKAAKLQILTATGGLLGASFALFADSAKAAGDQVAWILPFTSGGFIYIALCTVVPDLLKETSPKESAIQLLLLVSAIAIMGLVSVIE